MMMAQPFPAPGMAPGHPGMPHGHPMGVPHPGAGHMGGQPVPGMMQGMHPGVSGPQVTQGPMATGMPPGVGTPAPMQNGMAMAHLGPQQHMFQQQNPQMSIGAMQQMNHQAQLMRQRMLMQQQNGMQMNMQNNPQFHQQMAQMKMGVGMPMQQQQLQQMQANQHFQQQQQQHQQRMMAQHAAAQQAAAIQRQQSQQQAAAQMQMSRSQETTTQPPQSHPTPAPQAQPPQPQPQPNVPPQQQQQQQQPQQPQPQPQSQPSKPQPTPQQPQQQGTPQPQVKADGQDEEPQIKQQEMTNQMILQDIPKQPPNDFNGQCILQLLLYQDQLANPDQPNDLTYWQETIQKYFSPYGSIRQQLYNNKMGNDKSFQLQYPSLARFYYSHFTSGIKQILMQSFDHNQSKLPNGGIHIWSNRASLTYVFHNDLRVTTQGSLKVSFDEMQKIEHLFIATSGWTEYIPRHALQPASPELTKSPKLNKNQKKNQQKATQLNTSPVIPSSGVNDFGLPSSIVQFLEVAEVMTAMGPLMEYFHTNPGITPRDALIRINSDNAQANLNMQRLQQNANAMAANGQMQFPQQRMGMMQPNQLQSPALQHLGLPHGQNSPHMGGPNHTLSPAPNAGQGGVAMMHQMSAQGSNLSGSQGPSTNTSPNVSNKRRRPSAIKAEDENAQQDGASKVKPSPRMGGKRQKGQA